ncbi:MAG: transcription antitermination factor NusB [Candidatus Dasytiphilus stammeri]
MNRKRARESALQALYGWNLSGYDIFDIENQFLLYLQNKNLDLLYFHDLLQGVVTNYNEIDKLIKLNINRRLEHVGQVEKVILRISIFELIYRNEIPYKVIINEGIELSKIFGAQDSYKFINGVLDAIAMKLGLCQKYKITK